MALESALIASILGKLTSAGRSELSDEEAAALPGLVSLGLVTRVTLDDGAKDALTRLRAQLVAARGTPQETALRSEILRLSDVLAETSGGVEVFAIGDGGAYRAAGSALGTYHLTHKGRALLSDLGPRASRVTGLSLEHFGQAMEALKLRMAERAQRARDIMVGLRQSVAAESVGAARLAALGASARRDPVPTLAFYLEQAYLESATTQLTMAERWACAESAVLAVGPLEHSVSIAKELLKLRQALFTQYANGRTEDALDAAVLLVPWPERDRALAIEHAAGLANHFRSSTGTALPLSVALIVERTRAIDEILAARMVSMYRELGARGVGPDEAAMVSALLALSDGDAAWLVSRTDALQAYVGSFAPTSLWGPAAALALLDADVPEILDDLRVASAATQKYLLAANGAEAIGLAVKLLLVVAALGHGNEGDPEEALVLRPKVTEATQRLGLAGLNTSLPMILAQSATFHQPLLTAHDVALAAAPMHDSYVYGSGSSSGGWGSGYRSYGGSRGWG